MLYSSVGAELATGADSSFMNSTQKSVIHQKKILKKKKPQKLRPLPRAIDAGNNAKNTQARIINADQKITHIVLKV